MSTILRDTWLNHRPVIKTDFINKKITVPEFSLNCGLPRRCLKNTVTGAVTKVDTGVSTLDSLDLSAAFTIELWINPQGNYDTTSMVMYCLVNGAIVDAVVFSLLSQKLLLTLIKGGAPNVLAGSTIISPYTWTHVAATYDGVTAKLFVNGVQETTTMALAAPIDAATSAFNYIGNDSTAFISYVGLIDEFRLWQIARTQQQLLDYKNSPRGSTETGLKRYYRFNEAPFANFALNTIDGHQVVLGTAITDDHYITDEDSYPVLYGASFVAGRFTVNLNKSISFKFPVSVDDPDHSLVIHWTDDNDISQRRYLYKPSGVDYDSGIIAYNGEKVNAPFNLEIWNKDGETSVNLADELEIFISDTTEPNSPVDREPEVAATLTVDSTLAQDFPLTPFPISFNTQQVYT